MLIFENCLFRRTSCSNIDPRFFALSLVKKYRSVAYLTINILNRDFVALTLFDMPSYAYCRKYYYQRRRQKTVFALPLRHVRLCVVS